MELKQALILVKYSEIDSILVNSIALIIDVTILFTLCCYSCCSTVALAVTVPFSTIHCCIFPTIAAVYPIWLYYSGMLCINMGPVPSVGYTAIFNSYTRGPITKGRDHTRVRLLKVAAVALYLSVPLGMAVYLPCTSNRAVYACISSASIYQFTGPRPT